MPPRKQFEGCKWCKRSWDESCKPRRCRGLVCIDCDRHIYQTGAVTLNTTESRKKKLEEINTDPAKQEEWNADVKNTTMRGRTYGVSGRKANPEREGMDDDVKRTQGRKGYTTFGYFQKVQGPLPPGHKKVNR